MSTDEKKFHEDQARRHAAVDIALYEFTFYLALAFALSFEAVALIACVHIILNVTVDLNQRMVNQLLKGRKK